MSNEDTADRMRGLRLKHRHHRVKRQIMRDGRVAVVVTGAAAVMRAFALMFVWRWFVAPFGLADISIWHAAGLLCLPHVARHFSHDADMVVEMEALQAAMVDGAGEAELDAAEAILKRHRGTRGSTIFVPAAALAFAAACHTLMVWTS